MRPCPSCSRDTLPDAFFCSWCSRHLGAPEVGSKAGIFARWVALSLDPGLAFILFFFVTVVGAGVIGAITNSGSAAFFAAFLLVVGYIGWALSLFANGQTPGKLLLGLQVVDAVTGRPPGFGKMFVREIFGRFLSGLIFGFGYFAALMDKDGRAWHDRLAGTVVIRRRRMQAGAGAPPQLAGGAMPALPPPGSQPVGASPAVARLPQAARPVAVEGVAGEWGGQSALVAPVSPPAVSGHWAPPQTFAEPSFAVGAPAVPRRPPPEVHLWPKADEWKTFFSAFRKWHLASGAAVLVLAVLALRWQWVANEIFNRLPSADGITAFVESSARGWLREPEAANIAIEVGQPRWDGLGRAGCEARVVVQLRESLFEPVDFDSLAREAGEDPAAYQQALNDAATVPSSLAPPFPKMERPPIVRVLSPVGKKSEGTVVVAAWRHGSNWNFAVEGRMEGFEGERISRWSDKPLVADTEDAKRAIAAFVEERRAFGAAVVDAKAKYASQREANAKRDAESERQWQQLGEEGRARLAALRSGRTPATAPIAAAPGSIAAAPPPDSDMTGEYPSPSGQLRARVFRDMSLWIVRADDPRSGRKLLDFRRQATACFSPDDSHLIVNEYPDSGGGGAQLYRRVGAGGDGVPVYEVAPELGQRGVRMEDLAWEHYLKETGRPSNSDRNHVNLTGRYWSTAGDEAILVISVSGSNASNSVPMPWWIACHAKTLAIRSLSFGEAWGLIGAAYKVSDKRSEVQSWSRQFKAVVVTADGSPPRGGHVAGDLVVSEISTGREVVRLRRNDREYPNFCPESFDASDQWLYFSCGMDSAGNVSYRCSIPDGRVEKIAGDLHGLVFDGEHRGKLITKVQSHSDRQGRQVGRVYPYHLVDPARPSEAIRLTDGSEKLADDLELCRFLSKSRFWLAEWP